MPSLGDTLFGLAGLLVLVGLLPPLAQWLRVPNGVLLAGLGCVLGLLAGFGPHLPGVAGHLIGTLGALRPSSEVFLLIFLPVLLFEAALPLDVRDLLDDLAPVLLLAIVAVVLTTLTVGVAVAAVSPLGLVAACLLGAIVATTDPGAVIAVFREVGAPRRLTKLVEGESLLNDAAAIALFALLIDLLSGPALPAERVALGFVWSFVGGALFGAAAGRLGALVLRRLGDIRAAEVTVSVALPYLVFLAAQDQLELSGVVAVVAAGIVFGTDMRVSGHPASWSTLGAIWPQLGFWATSLIFVLAALRAPETLGALGADDLGVLLVVIAATLAARAACLFGLVPLLSSARLAAPIGTSFKLVMLWGGLRGAVTLALALGVIEDPRVPAGIDVTIAGLATGLVLFTLFVQAPTLRPLIRRLGLDRLSPTDRALRERAFVLAGRTIAERIHDAAEAYRLDPAQAAEVERRLRRGLAADDDPAEDDADMPVDRLAVGLATLAGQELALVHQVHAEETASRRVATRLAHEAQALLDAVRTGGRAGYHAAAMGQTGFDRRFRWLVRLHQHLGVSGPLARALGERFEVLTARARILRDLKRFTSERLGPLLGRAARNALRDELNARLEAVETALESLRLQYPEYGRALAGRYLERLALRLEDGAYQTMREDSLIGDEVLDDLKRELRSRRRAAERAPGLDLAMDLHELVRSVPLFAPLGPADLAEVAALLRPRLALPGERLIVKGTRGDTMFFVASGAVEVDVPPQPVRLGSGAFVGELALLTRQPRNADVTALGYARLLVLEGRDFRRFLRAHPDLRAALMEVARERLGRPLEPPSARAG